MNRSFRNRSDAPRLTPEQAERQGRISRLAFERFQEPKAAIAFLNTHHTALEGRPLDVAITSQEGLMRVEAALVAFEPS